MACKVCRKPWSRYISWIYCQRYLFENNKVKGVITGEKGVDKNGKNQTYMKQQ